MSEALLRSIYYDVSDPSSFGSVDKLYRAAKSRNRKIKRRDVEHFLSGEIAYTLHRNVVRKFKRNPVIAKFHKDLAQADLIDVSRYAKNNDGVTFILTLIDVFSKYAFAVPIKRKTAAEMTKALEEIFETYRPSNLQSDEGKEFTNACVQRLLKDYLINFYLAKNERIKCAVVERFQRTFMSKMHKYFTSKGTTRFIEVIPDLISSYNNAFHRSLRMTPIEATQCDTETVFKNLYGFKSLRGLLKRREKEKSKRVVGDHVRIPEQKHKFQKGYTQNFTDEIYTVTSVNQALEKPVYGLKTYKGDVIKGNFYPRELQKVRNEDKYRVVVLKERKRGRGKQYLMRWENFPDVAPEWISASRLESIA